MQFNGRKNHRFDTEANRVYQMPVSFFNNVKDNPMSLYDVAYKFIRHHVDHQVHRIKVLQDYYLGETDIKKWPGSRNPENAHNQVATGFARYITNIRVGYFMGNDIQFKVTPEEDNQKSLADTIDEQIKQFNQDSNESYIDEMIEKDLSVCGRAYDLVYVNENENTLNLAKVDPTTAFVVYDDSIKAKPLFAVRYYETGVLDDNLQEQYEIYTDSSLFKYHSNGGLPETNSPEQAVVFDDSEPLFFGRVPLTEYKNNDERTGDWEPELDQMDALDKALSTMANFQEDFNDAAMVITGKFANMSDPKYQLDKNGNPVVNKDGSKVILEPAHPLINPHNRMFYLKPYVTKAGINGERSVVNPTLQYITKQYDSAGWSTYINFLINEIHKYTNTPNVNDPNFASNASGVAMSYKLWGSDQERKIQESLYKRGLHARLSACLTYWDKLNVIPGTNNINALVSMIEPDFTPNLPKNDDATAQLIQQLVNTGKFSDETIREIAESITGVTADAEQQRVDEQQKHEADQLSQQNSGNFGIGKIFATDENAKVENPNDKGEN
ncbi:phage portal protein [Limosilactobacillus vaginalis]|uniref:phage portal protein n=1 Tax=Limosilactobacillus vaginalis TaxID=1633 RepID=UPI001CDC65A4|nr:phage portal protein [Limosilactobacillus vaginalis]